MVLSVTQVVIVTGANSGIGKELVWLLLERNVNVIITCRTEEKIQATVDEMKERWKARAKDEPEMPRMTGFVMELCSVKSVTACVNSICQYLEEHRLRIAALVNNAGATFSQYERTELGLECTFHGNYLGPYLFTLALLPFIIKDANSLTEEEREAGIRIVNVSSSGHAYPTRGLKSLINDADPLNAITLLNSKDYFSGNFTTYGTSKLYNLWFSTSLQEYIDREYGTDFPVYVNALHPGVIHTDIARNLNWFTKNIILPIMKLFILETPSGASGMLYLTLCKEEKSRGKYFVRVGDAKNLQEIGKAKLEVPSKLGQDDEIRKKFMAITQNFLSAKVEGLSPPCLVNLS